MIIRKGNQLAPMGYHDGIPIWDGIKPEPADVYYMVGNGTKDVDLLISQKFDTTDIWAKCVMLPMEGGDLFGITDGSPDWSDNYDFRPIVVPSWYNGMIFDCGSVRVMERWVNIDWDASKVYEIYLEKLGTACSCKWTRKEDGVVIWNPSVTNGNNVRGYFGIKAHSGNRIYSIQVGNSNGLILDAVATKDGLFDKISGNIITMSHFTPVKE